MSNSLNFVGNLGNDAEVRYTPNGNAVLQFSVAMASGYGDRKKTDWVRVSMWGKAAESQLVSYLKKGTAVFVSGECSINTYVGNDGLMKASLNLTAHSVDLVGKKSDPTTTQQPPAPPTAQKQGAQKSHDTPPNDDMPFDDDIPF